MNGKVVTGLLATAGIVLIGASAFITLKQDQTPPVITVGEQKLTYAEGDSYDDLLADVTAEDNVDGDLTDCVFVDRIIATNAEGSAFVVYGVVDSSNNVSTARRSVEYIPKVDEEVVVDAPTEEVVVNPVEKPVEEKPEEVNTPEKPEEAVEKEEKAEEKKPLAPNGKKPVIRLKSNSTKIKVGDAFKVLSFVDGVADDVDSKDDLYKHIHVDGYYDTKKAGSYKLTYYVTDSEENASEKITFTLVVK